jgi:hypothetical protein
VTTDVYASCILGIKLFNALSGFLFMIFFYLGPALFNRIQKRRIGRYEQWLIATAFDSFYHIMGVMNPAVVHGNVEALFVVLIQNIYNISNKMYNMVGGCSFLYLCYGNFFGFGFSLFTFKYGELLQFVRYHYPLKI